MPKNIDYEKIAAQIHEYYYEQWPDKKLPAKYKDLPEFLKEDNRAAARRISDVLSMAGLCIVPKSGADWTADEQSTMRGILDESIDLLAEAEHEGWVAARLRQGWKPGVEKNFDRREHHLIAPYSEFDQCIEVMLKHKWEQADKKKLSAEERAKDKIKEPTADNIRDQVKDAKDKDRDAVRNYVEIISGTDYQIVWEDHTDGKC